MRPALRPNFAALALLAGLAVPPAAHADVFQWQWDYRWSWGILQHETGFPDLDPAPDRAFYDGVVRHYDFVVSHLTDGRRFAGHGGDLLVENQPATGCHYLEFPCYRSKVTFDFGALFAADGDTATYRLTAWFPQSNAPWLPPMPALDQEWTFEIDGGVTSSAGHEYVAMSSYSPTTQLRVATPVPEPSTAALALLGGAMALAASRRRGR